MGLYSTIQDVMRSARYNVIRLGERALYRAFETYYALRELAFSASKASKEPASKPLRNPINRLVEFYVDHVWPGDLDTAHALHVGDEVKNGDKLYEAIEQIWEWSNWESKKSLAVRSFALKGDLFIKVVARPPLFADEDAAPDRVTFQLTDAGNVTDFDVDDRDIVTFIRLDIPSTRRNEAGELEEYVHTEVWNEDGMRVWQHQSGVGTELKSLGVPHDEMTLEEAGLPGLLPFVRAPFRDAGDSRGHNAFWAAIEKIDEASNLATRLHRDLFRTGPLWAVENAGKDSEGRPLPPPRLTADGETATTEIELGGEKMLSVSGALKCLIPNVNFAGMLEILEAQMGEIMEDLPELQYYRVTEHGSQIATATVRLLLAPAVKRVLEARSNADHGLYRANIIALMMAQALNFPGFHEADIGTYENGDFEHWFDEREVIPMSEEERAAFMKLQAEADLARRDLGIPWKMIMQERGYTEEEIEEMQVLLAEERQQRRTVADAMVEEALRRFDQGGQETEETEREPAPQEVAKRSPGEV